jgi:hypothetical protein
MSCEVDNKAIPGWDDVLTGDAGYGAAPSKERLKRIEKGAENIMDAILHGMVAVSELQWKASEHPVWPIEADEVKDIGVLQATLAELVNSLRSIESNAVYLQHQMELAETQAGNP